MGASLIRHLHTEAHFPPESLRAVVRGSAGASVAGHLPAGTFQVDYDDPSSMAAVFADADAIVHLAGVLRPRRGETHSQANAETTRKVVASARAAAVANFVYVSAPGAEPESPNDYLRSKGIAEYEVCAGGFGGAIFRVAMVLGGGSASLETLIRMASTRLVPLVAGGRVRVQPVAHDDVLRAIHWALARAPGEMLTLDLVGPETLPYVELLGRVATRLGTSPVVLPLPRRLIEQSAHVAGRVPRLGWNWSLFDTLFNEHLADSRVVQGVLPFELTRVDSLLDRLV